MIRRTINSHTRRTIQRCCTTTTIIWRVWRVSRINIPIIRNRITFIISSTSSPIDVLAIANNTFTICWICMCWCRRLCVLCNTPLRFVIKCTNTIVCIHFERVSRTIYCDFCCITCHICSTANHLHRFICTIPIQSTISNSRRRTHTYINDNEIRCFSIVISRSGSFIRYSQCTFRTVT